MSLEDNIEEKQKNSTLKEIITGVGCVVVAAAIAALLYFGVIKYVCDNYLTEEKLEQMVPGPYKK